MGSWATPCYSTTSRNPDEWQCQAHRRVNYAVVSENSLGNLPCKAPPKWWWMYSVAQINLILHAYHTWSTWKKIITKQPTTMQTAILRAYKASVSRSLQFPTDLVAHTFSLHRYADAFSLQQLLLTVLQGEKEWRKATWGLGLPKAQKKSTKMCVFSFSCGGAWKHVYKSYIFSSVHIHCITTYCIYYLYQICIHI